jgi:Repeat of unknown function (DUF5648)
MQDCALPLYAPHYLVEGMSRHLAVTVMFALCAGTVHASGGGMVDTTFGDHGIYVHRRTTATQADVSTRQIVALSGGRLLALGGMAGGPLGDSPWLSSVTFALTAQGLVDRSFADFGVLPPNQLITEYGSPGQRYVAVRELADKWIVLVSETSGCPSPSRCATSDPGPTYFTETLQPDTLGGTLALGRTSHTGDAAILGDGSVVSIGATYGQFMVGPMQRPQMLDVIATVPEGSILFGFDDPLAAHFLASATPCGTSGTPLLENRSPPALAASATDRVLLALGPCMMRMNRDGSLDKTFGDNGISIVAGGGPDVLRLLVLPDGSTLTFVPNEDGSNYRVVKRLPSGQADPSFGVGGVVAALDLPFALLSPTDHGGATFARSINSRGLPGIDSRGRVLLAGTKTVGAGQTTTTYLARYDSKMQRDLSFGDPAIGLALLPETAFGRFIPQSLAVDDADRIVLAGQTRLVPTSGPVNYSEAVMRLTADVEPTAKVIEFYNASLDHYFITWVPSEIAALDAGTTMKGWGRTGLSLRTFTSSQPGTSPICRFYIPPASGDSHFFGRGTDECNSTAQQFPTFVLEDPAFMHMTLPSGGTCPAGTREIYRLFNNRADANHRYTSDPAVRDQMLARGWVAEGDGPNRVTMCAPQ